MPTERRAHVLLFKPSGKFYTEEDWRIPDALAVAVPVPAAVLHSPDFHRIDGGPVLVEGELWGYPHLFPAAVTLPTWQEALAEHIARELSAQVSQLVAPADLVRAIEGRGRA
jgi:hypothetical protein